MPDSVDYLWLLKQNGTFPDPEKWLEYAETHQFNVVKGLSVTACPECNNRHRDVFAQYIYYSNLINLIQCKECDLIYSDLHLPSDVIQKHFEDSYNDDSYFVNQRSFIFRQVAELIRSRVRKNGSILDIGGAKGHLLNEVRKIRPDCTYLLNDLSLTSCDYAAKNFDLQSVSGPAFQIENLGRKFDFVSLVDVLYYESELARLWKLLDTVISDDGSILLRIPNHLTLIKIWSFFANRFSADKSLLSRVPFFNPEHIYIFSRRYINTKLTSLGFTNIEWLPSRILGQEQKTLSLRSGYFQASLIASKLPGTPIISPSTFVIGTRR